MRNEAKLAAQEALFDAIKTSAETNMKAALRATEKARILRDLAEAYRLTAGGAASNVAAAPGKPERTGRQRASEDGGRERKTTHDRGRKG
jgi:hypothetical protein